MNIIQYVRAFGKKKFSDLPFNEIDALIFSELAYINFDLSIKEMDFVTLNQLVIEDKKKFYYGSVDASKNRRLVEAMIGTKRFGDIKIGFCRSHYDENIYTQFFAMTIIMPNHQGFISYRGTDTSILGWKEDLYLTYRDSMPSQERAVNYIKEAATLFKGNFYIGGHSKGGNLAIYTALNMGEKLEKRLIRAYSFDGPGFEQDITELESFKRIETKLEKFLTTHDMIGVVYNRAKNPKIVYSNGILLGGHDPFYWSVNRYKITFTYSKDRSSFSRKSEEAMMNWLKNESPKAKQLAVQVICDIVGASKTIYDVLLNASRIISNRKSIFKGYSFRQKEEAKEIFKKLGKYYLAAYSPKRYLMNKKKKEVVKAE